MAAPEHHFRGHAVGFLVQPGGVTVAADMRAAARHICRSGPG
jgi:hypothetical protein